MFLLDKFEERGHVGPTKMVDRFQPGEHAPTLKSLKMVFANILKNKRNKSGHYFQKFLFFVLPAWLCANQTCGKTV